MAELNVPPARRVRNQAPPNRTNIMTIPITNSGMQARSSPQMQYPHGMIRLPATSKREIGNDRTRAHTLLTDFRMRDIGAPKGAV